MTDALSAPVLTLFDADSNPIATNTRWSTAYNIEALRGATNRLGAFALPEDSNDSAIFVSLSPGAYTAQTWGANDTSGVALVEVYEDGVGVQPGSVPPGGRLINTAVRARVGTGANVLTPTA